jgi:hypothetical protein
VTITVTKFKDVADGTQPGQFTIGDRETVGSLADLDPIYKRLLDERRVLFELDVVKVATFGRP